MFQAEMTVSEILRDPIILQVLRADGTTLDEFASFLKEAAGKMHTCARPLLRREIRSAEEGDPQQPV
ncbi:hypothetical protein [Roseixanthobacter pseudopolyaromaticivorans]|uniref:hypothetical protein n=1 Tax=Xanthobacteraceae TaxID=335928 RepID=UPI002BB745BB|nr:hypothetical protein [Hyphomicrobium sp.]